MLIDTAPEADNSHLQTENSVPDQTSELSWFRGLVARVDSYLTYMGDRDHVKTDFTIHLWRALSELKGVDKDDPGSISLSDKFLSGAVFPLLDEIIAECKLPEIVESDLRYWGMVLVARESFHAIENFTDDKIKKISSERLLDSVYKYAIKNFSDEMQDDRFWREFARRVL